MGSDLSHADRAKRLLEDPTRFDEFAAEYRSDRRFLYRLQDAVHEPLEAFAESSNSGESASNTQYRWG